jgi:hypothetical protein
VIIGLTGRKGHGKDTLARELVVRDEFVRLAFAAALKESAAALFDVPVETWDTLKNDPDAYVELAGTAGLIESRITVREFLQRYGTEAHRDVFGDDFWIDVMRLKIASHMTTGEAISATGGIVVTDVRFENEAKLIRDLGGLVIEVYRPQVVDSGDTHASEDIPRADACVWNGDTRAGLYSRLKAIIASRLT